MYNLGLRLVRCGFSFSTAICVLAVAFSISSICLSQDTPAEKHVLASVADGGDADFSGANHFVREDFVEKLLSGSFKKADPDHNLEVHGLTISNAVFQESVTVNFDVPYRVTFDHCEFQKGIEFSGGQFAKELVFNASVFGPSSGTSDQAVQFIGTTVNGSLSFKNVVFHIPADFTKSHVKELHLDDTTFGSTDPDDPDLDLTAARVESDFSVSVKGNQPTEVVAQFFSVGGSASLGHADTPFYGTKNLDLTYSRFQNLDIHGFDQWRANNHDCAVSLDGFTFQEIYIPGNGSSAWRMLDLLDSPQFCYSVQPYLALQQNLNASGDVGRANDAYIRMRNRQRAHRILSPKSPMSAWSAWIGDGILDLLVGYGREPWRAGLFAIVFILLGMLIFRSSDMVAAKSDDPAKPGTAEKEPKEDTKIKNAPYSSFWYSLDVLAPAIELGADKAWQPKSDWRFGRNYGYIHRIIGWILVPLILAALTGVVH